MSKDVDLTLGRSRVLLVVTVLLFSLSFVAVVILQALWFIKIVLVFLLAGSFYATLRHLLMLDQETITGLRSKRVERIWLAEFGNQTTLRLNHVSARVFKSLVILQLENPVNQRRYQCFVAADALSGTEHTELRALVLSLDESGVHSG